MDLLDNAWTEDRAWQVVALGSGALAGVVMRQALQTGWKLTQHEEPPENPAARKVGWGQALVWTVATSVAMGVAQLVAQRGAAAGWRKVRGRYPKGLD
jgi:hypothetical protein